MFKSKIEESGMKLKYVTPTHQEGLSSLPTETKEPICQFVSFEHGKKMLEIFGVKPFDPTKS